MMHTKERKQVLILVQRALARGYLPIDTKLDLLEAERRLLR